MTGRTEGNVVLLIVMLISSSRYGCSSFGSSIRKTFLKYLIIGGRVGLEDAIRTDARISTAKISYPLDLLDSKSIHLPLYSLERHSRLRGVGFLRPRIMPPLRSIFLLNGTSPVHQQVFGAESSSHFQPTKTYRSPSVSSGLVMLNGCKKPSDLPSQDWPCTKPLAGMQWPLDSSTYAPKPGTRGRLYAATAPGDIWRVMRLDLYAPLRRNYWKCVVLEVSIIRFKAFVSYCKSCISTKVKTPLRTAAALDIVFFFRRSFQKHCTLAKVCSIHSVYGSCNDHASSTGPCPVHLVCIRIPIFRPVDGGALLGCSRGKLPASFWCSGVEADHLVCKKKTVRSFGKSVLLQIYAQFDIQHSTL